jgi:hypothetical protein
LTPVGFSRGFSGPPPIGVDIQFRLKKSEGNGRATGGFLCGTWQDGEDENYGDDIRCVFSSLVFPFIQVWLELLAHLKNDDNSPGAESNDD